MADTQRVDIEIVEGPGTGTALRVTPEHPLVIGRGSGCSLPLRGDRALSRRHLCILVRDDGVFLEDLGSHNGTLLNDEKVGTGDGRPEPHILSNGDRIQAGRTVLFVRIRTTPRCAACDARIPAADRRRARRPDGSYRCAECSRKAGADTDTAPDATGPFAANPEKLADVVEKLRQAALGTGTPASLDVPGYEDAVLIGEGGFGKVHRVRRMADGAPVALKTLNQGREAGESDLGLFRREQEIAMQLRHPNIVRTLNCGTHEKTHFIEMEYVPDGNLSHLMRRHAQGRFPLDDARAIMLGVLEGLAYAHEAKVTVTTRRGTRETIGVVHRDLKPANILITLADGKPTPKISDYGLAKAFAVAGSTLGRLTVRGVWKGTTYYMAPEHVLDYRFLGPATDVFEAAATFFHMLTGEGVWPIVGGVEPYQTILNAKPKSVRACRPDVPAPLARVLGKALTTDPGKRFRDGLDFLSALQDAL